MERRVKIAEWHLGLCNNMEFSYCGVFNITTGQLWPVSCIPIYNIFLNVFIHGVISTFLLLSSTAIGHGVPHVSHRA